MGRSVRVVLTVLAALCVGLGVVSPTIQVQAQEQPPTVLILDASGSMLATDVGGGTRMDAAKTAISNYLDKATGTPPGLVVYGTNTGSSDAEKDAGCQDVTKLARPGEMNTADLKGKVAGVNASGYTPIGKSLRDANSLLPGEGDRTIVLVSDGIDTCAPPPVCEVAKELKAAGTQLVVHTIGFQVDEQARAELQCIADATGGTYADAKDAGSLENTITTASTRTATGYTFPDKTIQGTWASTSEEVRPDELTSDQIASLPVVEPGTTDDPVRFHLTLPKIPGGTGIGSTRSAFLKVPLAEGTRLQVGAAAVPPTRTGTLLDSLLYMDLYQYSLEGHSCGIGDSGSGDPLAFELPFVTGLNGEVIGEEKINGMQQCPAGESLLQFSIGGSAMSQQPIDVDVTLAAVAEPTDFGDSINQVADADDLKRTEDKLAPPAAGNDTHVAPAYTPDQAQTLNGTTTTDIVEGETHYFAVDADWGQHIDANLEIIKDDYTGSVSSGTSRQLEMAAVGPLGQPVSLIGRGTKNEITTTSLSVETGRGLNFGTALPITYASNNDSIRVNNGSWLAGRHVIAVSMTKSMGKDTDATTQSAPVTYRLALKATGDAVQGPTFPDTPVLKSSPSPSTNTESPRAQPTTSNDESGFPLWGWAAAGGGTILIAAIIAAVVTIRHSRTHRP